MFCAPVLVFSDTEGVVSRFHILRPRTRFRWCRVRLVPFTRFAHPDSFLTVLRVPGPVFTFCAAGLVFGGTDGVGSRFDDLPARIRFRWYRGRRVPFSCFAPPFLCSAIPKAWGPVFIFCAPGLIFGSAECVGSSFQVLPSRTSFRWRQVRRVPFGSFSHPDSFSAKPRAPGLVFMLSSPGFVFDGTEGVGYRSHVVRARTHFRRYRGRRVPFSSFALPELFSAVPSSSGPVFTFCAPEFIFCGAECVGSRFHVLPTRTCFRGYRGRRVPFSSFARPDSFSAVLRASNPVFMFCASKLFFGGIEGVEYRFHVLRSRTRFRRYRGCRVRRVPFSRFACPELIFGGIDGVGSRFQVLRARTRFRQYRGRPVSFHVLRARSRVQRYRGRRVPFSSFALSDSF
jgi:hypothetical protein